MSLYILDVCDPKHGWMEPKIFEPDPNQDPKEQNEKTTLLDQEIKFWQDKGFTTTVKVIHGMAIEPLRKYFTSGYQY